MRAKLRRRGLPAPILGVVLGASTALAACSTMSSVRETVGEAASQAGDTAHAAAREVGTSIRSASDTVSEKVDPLENKVGTAIADKLPASAGGLPAGIPARPDVAPAFLAVHDMPPPRELKKMTIEERKKLEADLKALRDRQEKLNPNSQAQTPAAPVAKAAAVKKPPPAKPAGGLPPAKPVAEPAQSADAQSNR